MRYNATRNRSVLYPSMPDLRLGQCDCDCACALDLPQVIQAQSASAALDCDCACAADGSVVLSVDEQVTPALDCDCACASVGRPHGPAVTSGTVAAPTLDCDCACASVGRPQGRQLHPAQWPPLQWIATARARSTWRRDRRDSPQPTGGSGRRRWCRCRWAMVAGVL